MNLENIKSNLTLHLEKSLPKHTIAGAYRYAVLPPGKAFRPQLVWAIFEDFSLQEIGPIINNLNSPHNYLASFVEVHHAYTLVHDDLPCMDDDDLRRGKMTTHKKFGEWKALLVGDGLLSCSYQLLAQVNCQNSQQIFKFSTWALGPKGLIQGQVLDLSEEMTDSFSNLILTHQNKTARLIQTSIVSSFLAIDREQCKSKETYQTAKRLFRLGHHMGVAFQLLDDLTELVEERISPHELSVNPWLRFNEQCISELIHNLETISTTMNVLKMESFKEVLKSYLNKIQLLLTNGQGNLESHTGNELLPVMLLLKRICH